MFFSAHPLCKRLILAIFLIKRELSRSLFPFFLFETQLQAKWSSRGSNKVNVWKCFLSLWIYFVHWIYIEYIKISYSSHLANEISPNMIIFGQMHFPILNVSMMNKTRQLDCFIQLIPYKTITHLKTWRHEFSSIQ